MRGQAPVPAQDLPAGRRLFWADLVRVYAMAGVVLLHTVAMPNTQFGQVPMDLWWRTNIYTALVCTAIPLFVMLSGGLLLTQEHWDPLGFARRRLAKVLLPLPVWTLIYAGCRKYFWNQDVSMGDVLRSFVTGISDPVFPHLWFMYLILSLYLIVPVLRIFFLHSSLAGQLYFAALWIVASALKPVVERACGIELGYYLSPFFGFIGYFLLGATIFRHAPARAGRTALAACWAAVAVGYVVTLLGTYRLSSAAGRLDRYFYLDFSVTSIPMSVATFVLLRHFGSVLGERARDYPRLTSAVTTLSALSFGIYLAHALVIVLLESGKLGFTLTTTTFEPLLAAPVMAAIVFAVSAAATFLVRRTPALRWLAP